MKSFSDNPEDFFKQLIEINKREVAAGEDPDDVYFESNRDTFAFFVEYLKRVQTDPVNYHPDVLKQALTEAGLDIEDASLAYLYTHKIREDGRLFGSLNNVWLEIFSEIEDAFEKPNPSEGLQKLAERRFDLLLPLYESMSDACFFERLPGEPLEDAERAAKVKVQLRRGAPVVLFDPTMTPEPVKPITAELRQGESRWG